MNYFISKEDDICTSKSGVKDYLTENGLLEIEVFEAKRITTKICAVPTCRAALHFQITNRH